MNKRKMSLMATLGVSLFAVVAASVSTYAWYQATASATITASPSSTTITVSKPKDYTFYAYKGNSASSWSNKGRAFADDFERIDGTNEDTYTRYTGLTGQGGKINPGDIKTFAIGMAGRTAGNITFKLTSVTSNTIGKEKKNASYHRYIQSTSTDINIGWAMNIYSKISSDGSGYADFVSSQYGSLDNSVYVKTAGKYKISVSATADSYGFHAGKCISLATSTATATTAGSGSYTITQTTSEGVSTTYPLTLNEGIYSAVITFAVDDKFVIDMNGSAKGFSDLRLDTVATSNFYHDMPTDRFNYYYSGDSSTYSSLNNTYSTDDDLNVAVNIDLINETVSYTSCYIIYSVVFTNFNTTWYKEKDSSEYALIPKADTTTSPYRVFEESITGNSNCYADLSFNLNAFSLTF